MRGFFLASDPDLLKKYHNLPQRATGTDVPVKFRDDTPPGHGPGARRRGIDAGRSRRNTLQQAGACGPRMVRAARGWAGKRRSNRRAPPPRRWRQYSELFAKERLSRIDAPSAAREALASLCVKVSSFANQFDRRGGLRLVRAQPQTNLPTERARSGGRARRLRSGWVGGLMAWGDAIRVPPMASIPGWQIVDCHLSWQIVIVIVAIVHIFL